PRSTLFPYTTLFRSRGGSDHRGRDQGHVWRRRRCLGGAGCPRDRDAAGGPHRLRRAPRGGGVVTTMAVTAGKPSALDALLVLLRALKLPAFTRYAEE